MPIVAFETRDRNGGSDSLSILALQCTLQFLDNFPEEGIELANLFRSSFGYYLRRVSCISRSKGEHCESCWIQDRCPYFQVFHPAISQGKTPLWNEQEIPHPFIFHFPSRFRKNNLYTFNLTFIGIGEAYAPYAIHTIDTMGRSGTGPSRLRFSLIQVINRLNQQEYWVEGQEIQNTLQGEVFQFQNEQETCLGSLHILLNSPMRIKYQNKYITKPLWYPFIISLIRRITLLSHYYGQGDPKFNLQVEDNSKDSVRIINERTQFKNLERFSQHQGHYMTLGGMVGTFDLEGNIQPFIPILNLGQYIHNGKNTSFGFGNFSTDFRVTGA